MLGRILQPVVFKANLIWCLLGKRLTRSLCVVKQKVFFDALAQCRHWFVHQKVNVFVIYTEPESLNKNILYPTAFSIHTNLEALRHKICCQRILYSPIQGLAARPVHDGNEVCKKWGAAEKLDYLEVVHVFI
jgi:hypothetical protein